MECKLCREYPSSLLEVGKNAWDPDPEGVEYFGLVRARKLCREWFQERALRAIDGDRYTVGLYYGYGLHCVLSFTGERKGGTARPRRRLQSLGPAGRGSRERPDRLDPNSTLDDDYQPLDPRQQDVACFGRRRAEQRFTPYGLSKERSEWRRKAGMLHLPTMRVFWSRYDGN